MNCRWTPLLLIGCLATPAFSQEQASVEQLQKQVEGLNEQLKAAQDRKSELNTEIQRLQKKVADAEHSASDFRQKFESLQNRSYFLTEQSASWESFLARYPRIRDIWNRFVAAEATGELPGNDITDLLGDGNWPFIARKSPLDLTRQTTPPRQSPQSAGTGEAG